GAAVDVVGARVGSGRGAGDQGAVAAGGGELEGGAGPGGGLRGAAFPPAGRRGVRAVRVGRPAGVAFEVVGVDGVGRLLRAALAAERPDGVGDGVGVAVERGVVDVGGGVAGGVVAPVEGDAGLAAPQLRLRSEEHTSELQSRENLVCRLLLEKKKY